MNGLDLSTISDVYVGSTQYSSIYYGSTLVWQRGGGTIVHDYSLDYFTIESLQDGNEIKMQRNKTPNNPVLEYSLDNGQTWTSVTINGAKTFATINTGDTILFRGNNAKLATAWDTYNKFNTTKQFKVYGNAMSLLNGNNFVSNSTFDSGGYNLCGLFYGVTTLVDASNLILPATTLYTSCYNGMFRGCTNLEYGPKLLPSLNVPADGYSSMFEGCVKLIEAPEILATSVSGNTALNRMFCMNRNSKVTATMTKGPVLRITNPSAYSNTYQQLFCGNGNLTEVTILVQATNLTFSNWLNYTNTGGVIKTLSGTTFSSGVSGLPSGWTTQEYSE